MHTHIDRPNGGISRVLSRMVLIHSVWILLYRRIASRCLWSAEGSYCKFLNNFVAESIGMFSKSIDGVDDLFRHAEPLFRPRWVEDGGL